jgi:hypothetical protein
MLLSKTQNPTEGGEVNSIVSAIRHPMYIIYGLIIEVDAVELCKYLLILVILEPHDVGELKVVTDPDDLVKLRLLLVLQLILVNILHLPYLGLPHTKNSSGIEVGMKLIPKPIVDVQSLRTA